MAVEDFTAKLVSKAMSAGVKEAAAGGRDSHERSHGKDHGGLYMLTQDRHVQLHNPHP